MELIKKIFFVLIFSVVSLFGQDKYSRSLFGDGWNTYKGCITVREHVLISNSKKMVNMDSKRCTIVSGEWYSIWEDKLFYKPSDLDIDHTVPLKWAYDHGADKWDKEKRNNFANNYHEKYHLVPLSFKLNRSKGDKGPDKWLPPFNRCLYIKTFLNITHKYNLKLSYSEKKSINSIQKKECK